jgi:hypothetical protein
MPEMEMNSIKGKNYGMQDIALLVGDDGARPTTIQSTRNQFVCFFGVLTAYPCVRRPEAELPGIGFACFIK